MFGVGDFVFARVRGYPAWPAKIVSILDPRPASMKFTVFFFGTSETATVTSKDVFSYSENRERFNKPIKRKFFNEGIKELEDEMKKKAGTSNDQPTLPTNASKPNKRSLAVDSAIMPPKSQKRSLDAGNAEGAPQPAKRVRKSKSTTTEPQKELPKEVSAQDENPSSQPIQSKRTSRRASSAAGAGATNEPEKKEPEPKLKRKSSAVEAEDKQTSRSGRVIKPKKFLYDEEASEEAKGPPKGSPSPKVPDEPTADESPSPKKKKKKAELPKLELAPLGRVLWSRIKGGQLVQVKVDHERPPQYKDDKSRAQWDKDYEKYLAKLKLRIESGEDLPDDVPVQLAPSPEALVNMTEEQITNSRKSRVLERKKGKLRWIKLEERLIDIDVLIKTYLQKNKVDMDKALSLLDELINLPIDPLMLKKHTCIVETTKKIGQYSGNFDSWNITPEEKDRLKRLAGKVRTKAEVLINKFKGLFAVARTDNFWTTFVQSVDEFKVAVRDLPRDTILSLTCDPGSEYFQEFLELEKEEDKLYAELNANMEKDEV